MGKEDVVCVCVCIYIYICNAILAIREKEITPFAAKWMDLEIIIQSKVSQRKTNTTYILICGV